MPVEKIQIYISRDGKKLGPFTSKQIHTKLFQGKLSGEDQAWHAGLVDWVPLRSILEDLPAAEIPPPPPSDPGILTFGFRRFGGLSVKRKDFAVIPRGEYEPEATLKQKNFLVRLGLEDTDALKRFGKDQASNLIDQVLEFQKKGSGCGCLVFLIILGIGIYALIHYFSGTEPPSMPTPQPPTASVSSALTRPVPVPPLPSRAILLQSVQIQLPYGTATIPKGTAVQIIHEEGEIITVRTGANQDFNVRREQVSSE